MLNELEYRVVSTRVFGTFKVFDSEDAAKKFMGWIPVWTDPSGVPRYDHPQLMNDEHGPFRLEVRRAGGTKHDWQEVTQ